MMPAGGSGEVVPANENPINTADFTIIGAMDSERDRTAAAGRKVRGENARLLFDL